MDRTSDVGATWGWGLRRYAWVVALFVVALGVLVPLAQSRSAEVYVARAQVGPTEPLLLKNLDPLPRFAQSVFTNGAVAQDVRRQLGLAADETVIPGTVELSTAQDNPVMVVEARSGSPSTATAVADKAAATFVLELNKYSASVGTFAVQHGAVVPAQPSSALPGGYAALVVGLLAGLVAGLGAVGLILVVRRPVVGVVAAEGATGLPVLGSIRLPRGGPTDGTGVVGIGALARRLLVDGNEIVYLTGPVPVQVDLVSANLRGFLARVPVTPSEPTGAGGPGGARRKPVTPEIVALETSSLEEWIASPTNGALTLLVVPEGIRARSLRTLVDRHASGSPLALALVAMQRRGLGFASKRRHEAALASQPG